MDKQAAIQVVEDAAHQARAAVARHGEDSPEAQIAVDRTGLAIGLAVRLARQ